MKNKLNRILSLILILASLVSVMSVFAFAEEEGGDDTTASELQIIYNRSYEEGWEYTNGLSDNSNGNKFYVDYEELSDYSYNYFLRLEASTESGGYGQLDFQTNIAKEDQLGTVIEMRVKVDDYATSLGEIMSFANASNKWTEKVLNIEGNKLMFWNEDPVEICALSEDWVQFAIAFDWTTNDLTVTLHYGDFDEATHTYSKQYTVTKAYASKGDKGIKYIRFGIPASSSADRIGASVCIDDLRVYNGNNVPVDVDPENYGLLVNAQEVKTIDIIESSKVKNTAQLLEEALCMKVGVNYALARNVKTAIATSENGYVYGAPVVDGDGVLRIPLELVLDYIGFPKYVHPDKLSYDITTGTSATYLTVGHTSATVDGKAVELVAAPGYVTAPNGTDTYLSIALDDVETLFPGWLATYDDMGLIIIYEDVTPDNKEDNKPIVTRDNDLSTMLNIMKKFIFEVDTVATNEIYTNTGKKIYADVKANTAVSANDQTTSFNHPYLITNQASFDKLNAAYTAGEDAVLKGYIQTVVDRADEIYDDVAALSGGAYAGIKADKLPVNIHASTSDGYSAVGGRLDNLPLLTEKLVTLAFAYQVTRDNKYALLAYDYSVELGKWDHWGPGYFIDLAEATADYAIAYDWLYNAYKALNKDTAALAEIIFEKGVHQGYNSSMGLALEHNRNLGDNSAYTTRDDHWNAVGSSGMVLGALAIMDTDAYLDEVYYVVGNNITNLFNRGLDEYAPDGSYIESAVNWCYSTNQLFYLVMSLNSAAGNDYGFTNTWGLDKTWYYALQIESSDGFIWNYHDGGADGVNGALATMDTHIFNYAGKLYNDPNLIAIRKAQLDSGKKSVSVFDLIFYPYEGVGEVPELPLNYHMQGIDAYVSRTDWSDGAMYTGLMGGANDANYGHVDSGNFIYHNKGVVWFMDLGSDSYNAYQYFGSARNRYYRVNAEGQNVVYMTSATVSSRDTVPFSTGQYEGGGGKIISTFENEYGSYAILSNASVFPGFVSDAKRGLLVTNNKNTVVIQDEIAFMVVCSAEWVAHTAQEIVLSQDARTAYLKNTAEDGTVTWLRASIVTPVKEFVFSVATADTLRLGNTYGKNDSFNNGGEREYSREGIQKLIISCENALSFMISVAFEIVDGVDSDIPVGYTWQTMTLWTPLEGAADDDGTVKKRDRASKVNIKTYTDLAANLLKNGDAFDKGIQDFYDALTLVTYTFTTFKPESDPTLINSYDKYLDCLDEYNDFMEHVNDRLAETRNVADLLSGQFVAPEADEN